MAAALAKMGPLLAVTGLAGYCLMPMLSPARSLAQVKGQAGAEEQPPRIESKLLEPELEPAMERNPFDFEAPLPAAAQAGALAGKQPEGKAEPEEPDWLEKLSLGATLVHGRRKAAVINGRVYSEGEKLVSARSGEAESVTPVEPGSVPAPSEPSTPELMVARVERDRVILWWQERSNRAPREVVLSYPAYGSKKKQLAKGSATAGVAGGATPTPEPGSLQHLQALSNPAQMQAVMGLAQQLLGGMMPTQSAGAAGAVPRAGAVPTQGLPLQGLSALQALSGLALPATGSGTGGVR